jgi:hypothetical protein
VGWLFSIVILSAALSAAPAVITDANKQLTAELRETQRQAAAANAARAEEARATPEARARETSRRQMEREKSGAWSQ